MTTNTAELKSFMNGTYMCHSLTEREVETFLEYTELVESNHNDVIAEIGAVGEALFFVIDGGVALFHDERGTDKEIAVVKPGELMGEMSFFDRNPRQLRIRATKDHTRLLKLSRTMYKRLRVEHPYIAVNLLEFAIVSLDHMFRRLSSDMTQVSRYLYSPGKK